MLLQVFDLRYVWVVLVVDVVRHEVNALEFTLYLAEVHSNRVVILRLAYMDNN